ncbi:MAG: hypothetical protein NVS2B12_02240 [Ktedonobacteraceae bacterium]
MKLYAKKHALCPLHQDEGILIVDVESEKKPRKDEQGNILYYCPRGPHFFSIPPGGDSNNDANGTRKIATMVSRS